MASKVRKEGERKQPEVKKGKGGESAILDQAFERWCAHSYRAGDQ